MKQTVLRNSAEAVGRNVAPAVGNFVLFQFYFTMCDGLYKLNPTCKEMKFNPAHLENCMEILFRKYMTMQ